MQRSSLWLAAFTVCLLWPSNASSRPLFLPTSDEQPAMGSALVSPAELLAGCQYLSARSARLGDQSRTAEREMERALDEMLQRRNGRVVRWVRPPDLVVLTSVMEYQAGAQTAYEATSEFLGDQEIDALVGDLTGALALLTGNTFRQFGAVRLESTPAGTKATVMRPGQIVVGRYRGLRDRLSTVGLGGKVAYDATTIGAGLILLDRDYDRSSSLRRLLRTHELGHALGYRHVESSLSIMNPRIGSEPTDLDRRAALVAFQGMAAASGVSCPMS